MLGPLEIVLILAVLIGLLLIQTRTRFGSLAPYLAVGILLLVLIVAVRIIRSLVSIVIIVALVCGFLLWKFVRSG